jgi:hypothetical protein
MKFQIKNAYFLILTALLLSCSNDDNIDKDTQKPTISINYAAGFPQACQQLVKGETYIFKAQLTDNQELASYSLDIHHNFDHHTHDDQGEPCVLSAIKEAISPYIFMQNYNLERGLTSHEINLSITIPDNIDTGDYHCSYSVTDITGWQSRTSIDIKIID